MKKVHEKISRKNYKYNQDAKHLYLCEQEAQQIANVEKSEIMKG